MQLASYALQVMIAGKPAREYGHDGRTFIAGREGADYSVRLTNRSSRRVKAVVAVDGLSVIDGKAAGQNGPGYVLEPHSTLDVPGWRLSEESVARFCFGNPESSLAASGGTVQNVGVLAAAFFEEQRQAPAVMAMPMNAPAIAKGGATRSAGSAMAAGGGSLGTGFGRKVDHAVKKVEFDARTSASAIIEVRYEDASILRAYGIDVDDEAAEIHSPNAFPAGGGYCSPPRNWRS
jgi:hypothetical protein